MAIKKAAILTFHYAHNYGAVLQALALKKYIESMGIRVKIINYRNKKVDAIYKSKLKLRLRRKWLKPRHWKEIFKQGAFIRYATSDWERKQQNFEKFIREEIVSQEDVISFDELPYIDTDLFLVGSDQVWDKGITGGLDRGYFLDFETSAKKVSYAASMSSWKFSRDEIRKLKRYLSGFDAISVREQAIANKLDEYSSANIHTVIDPTLLLDSGEYLEWEETETLEEEKYVFAYFVTESEELMRCARKIAGLLGLKLLELHYYKLPQLDGHNQIADIGPSQFLWYVKHAQLIVTNSFHGTVFSILYEKQFYAVYKDGKNERIQNILLALHLADRHIQNEVGLDVLRPIDFKKTRALLEGLRSTSGAFLKDAFEQ